MNNMTKTSLHSVFFPQISSLFRSSFFLCQSFIFSVLARSVSSVFPSLFHAINKCKPSSQRSVLPVARIQSPIWAEKGFAFGLVLKAWICLFLIGASAPLVITRHYQSDSQLDAFLNPDPEIRLWMTVTLQCPSSRVFKLLSLLLNDSNLPINPFSVWRGNVLSVLVSTLRPY